MGADPSGPDSGREREGPLGEEPGAGSGPASRSWLDRIEGLGNALPDPATLFLLGTGVVVLASALASGLGWQVVRLASREGELVREPLRALSLLSSDGLYWLLRSMVENFIEFPPLGVVLVGMLGIGVAERSGFIGAALKALMLAVPRSWLTPTLVFVGVMSSMGLDAGYVVLPPVAAALFAALGRSPLAGLAAVFAGVSAGFGANLLPTSLDPLLAGLSTSAAQLVDADYQVAATANWWFMIASTGMLTVVGWGVTALWVEPRLDRRPTAEGGPDPEARGARPAPLDPEERRGLAAAGSTLAAGCLLTGCAVWIPGAPLDGSDGPFPRWVAAVVPLLFVLFLLPGLAYGFATGRIRSDRDVAAMMAETMAGMGSYIVLAFFAAQFISAFRHSGLGEMLAVAGGEALARSGLGASPLMLGFVGVVMAANLLIGSMSAKYAFLAPVFVPMFMQVGISPELTQVAYRVGDSVTNVITPLNPYLVIVLVFMRRHAPGAGIGTLVAMMLPYALVFALCWSALLLGWIALGLELGQAGPLGYSGPVGGG